MASKLTPPSKDDQLSFTLFPRLPAELRLKIWSHCLEPQVIHIWPCKQKPELLFASDTVTPSLAPTRIPLWDISQESRSWARAQGMVLIRGSASYLERVQRRASLGIITLGCAASPVPPPPRALFDPRRDGLYLHCEATVHRDLPGMVAKLDRHAIRRVRYLVLHVGEFVTLAIFAESAKRWTQAFEDLELVIVVGKEFKHQQIGHLLRMIRREHDVAQGDEDKRWKMPGWRFVPTVQALHTAVREGRVTGLEGIDADAMGPYVDSLRS